MTTETGTIDHMSPRIRGIGLAVPPHSLDQEQAADLCVAISGIDGEVERLARTFHRRSGIARRGCVLLKTTAPATSACDQSFFVPRRGDTDRGPTTAARMAVFQEHAPSLAARAALEALLQADLAPRDVTHLVTVSCTGFAAPGTDFGLVALLGLRPDVQRAHVGFMGCHGAINGLHLAHALAAEGGCVLLVSVELCTLHLHVTDRPDQLIANAIFGDGAAACIVQSHSRGMRVLGTAACIFPQSTDAMAWTIGDHGFEMTLSQSVPDLIREHLRGWMADAAGRFVPRGAGLRELNWCVHPGGPKVLDAVREALELEEVSLKHSRGVLHDHGNMSSATVLFILQRMQAAREHGPTVLLAFGPGLCAEACFVEL